MTDGLRIARVQVDSPSGRLVDARELDLPDGRVVALIGASGAGKTLMVRALAGVLEAPLVPSAQLSRTDGSAPDIGWMPQNPRHALDPYRTVGEQLDATHRRHPGGLDAAAALERVGLVPHDAQRFPAELSGGMAQRVVLAQLLATGASTLVVDEPTSGLDPILSASVRATLHAVAHRGPGILWVTHDLRRIDDAVHEVWVMHGGRIVERSGRMDQLTHPASTELRRHTPGLKGSL